MIDTSNMGIMANLIQPTSSLISNQMISAKDSDNDSSLDIEEMGGWGVPQWVPLFHCQKKKYFHCFVDSQSPVRNDSELLSLSKKVLVRCCAC